MTSSLITPGRYSKDNSLGQVNVIQYPSTSSLGVVGSWIPVNSRALALVTRVTGWEGNIIVNLLGSLNPDGSDSFGIGVTSTITSNGNFFSRNNDIPVLFVAPTVNSIAAGTPIITFSVCHF
jgi:hypothetical protein